MLRDCRKLSRLVVVFPFDKTNGTSNRKLPPKLEAAVPWNQEAEAVVMLRVRLFGLKVCPDTGVNWIFS